MYWAYETRSGGRSRPKTGFALAADDGRTACNYGCYATRASRTLRDGDEKSWVGTDASLPETASREPGNGPSEAGC